MYILIMTLLLSGSNNVTSTTTTMEFSSLKACQNAAFTLEKENSKKIPSNRLDNQVFVCAKK